MTLKRGRTPEFNIDGAGLLMAAAKTTAFQGAKHLINIGTEEKEERVSYLGTPVFANMEISGGSYETLAGEEIPFDGIRVDGVLMSVTQPRNIIQTQIQNRPGTIKEYISEGDFMVHIEGIISGESFEQGEGDFKLEDIGNIYPYGDVSRLIKICGIPGAFRITSTFLNQFDITDVVVELYRFPQVKGFRDQQPFILDLLSDGPIELAI